MGLAFDKTTLRRKDNDGRLHVQSSNISKAVVNDYLGSEIMGGDEIGLIPDKRYAMLRDPDELAKAAPTFNNLPLLNKHIEVNAGKPEKDSIVGTTGTDAVFNAPYLVNSLSIWDGDAIAAIEDDSIREISCSYWYDADMTPGVYEGVAYDGIMRNIQGNHVALVEAGRAGSDVYVSDSLNLDKGENVKKKMSLSARLVAAAVGASLGKQLLAADAKVNIGDLTKGITAKRWVIDKPVLAAKLHKILGADASIEDLTALLDGLDGEVVAMDEEEPVTSPAAVPEKDAPAKDADPHDAILQFLSQKGVSQEDLATVKEMLGKEEVEEMAMDGEEEIDEVTGKPTMASDSKRKVTGYVSVKAMDAAIKTSTAAAVAAVRNLNAAVADVAPYVGTLNLAFDSATEVYRAALEMMNIDVGEVHPSAYKAVLLAQPKPGATRATANDAAVTGVDLSWIAEKHNGHKVKTI